MLAILINQRLLNVTIEGLRRYLTIGLIPDRLLHEHASQFQPDLHPLVFDLGKPSAPFPAHLFAKMCSRSSRATSASLLAISGDSVFVVRAIATSLSGA